MSSTLKKPKISECLYILNNRQLGVLNRLHFMKCTLSESATRPNFMPGGDKSYDNAWKILLKKFPIFDVRSNASSLNVFVAQKELLKQMSSLYYNLVDVLEVKDNVTDLLNRITYSGIKLDITVNSDLTRLYLELVTNYFAMMYFLTRISDLKAILILFNYLYEQASGKQEPNFGRMCNRFAESPELVLQHLHTDLIPHSKVLSGALSSLNDFFSRRIVRAQNWRDSLFLNILSEPKKIKFTALSDQLACELLPYEVMERWVVFGYLLTDPNLPENDEAFNRLRLAIRNSYVVVLYREEVINVHTLLTTFFETVWTSKLASKRVSDTKEAMSIACSQAPGAHADRRAYLRQALRQLHYILADQPGLLGPKAFIVFWGLSYATDEIHWLLRHSSNVPPKKNINFDDFIDPGLPELLFYMEDLRNLVRKYASVIQRFHIQMLPSYDAPGLEEYLRPVLSRLPMDEVDIFNSMLTQLRDVEINVASNAVCEFTSLRLDWLRLQATLSSKDSPLVLADCRRLVEHLHSTIFHTRLVDQLDDLLRQVSDLSIFFFYRSKFEELFSTSLSYPTQLRYIGVFPTLCTSFTQACHEMCPKEQFLIGRAGANLTKIFCRKLIDSICNAFFTRMEELCDLAEQLAPTNSVAWLVEERSSGKKREIDASVTGKSFEVNGNAPPPPHQPANQKRGRGAPAKVGAQRNNQRVTPGVESLRRDRVEQTYFDKTLFTLSQLCTALTYRREIHAFDEVFDPRMFLQSELQARLFERFSPFVIATSAEDGQSDKSQSGEQKRLRKPSEMLRRTRATMNALIELENFIRIDVVAMFSNVFGQHTQPVKENSGKNQTTVTGQYAHWYVDCFIQQAYLGHFVYSPLLKSFVTIFTNPLDSNSLHFRAEDFGDLNELRALAELIGPVGMKYICDQLTEQVGARMEKIKPLVLTNRSVLEDLRGSFDNPVKTRQLAENLQQADILLSYLTEIGVALAFQSLCHEAVGDVLELRAPFLLATTKSIKSFMLTQASGKLLPPTSATKDYEAVRGLFERQLLTANLCAAMGIDCELDAELCLDLRARRQLSSTSSPHSPTLNGVGDSLNLDYHIACLFIVFVANALPHLARAEGCAYHINLAANQGNIHCIAQAVTTIMIVMFSVLNPGDLEERSTEFLALASSNLLRLGLETNSSLVSAEISGGGGNNGDGEGRKTTITSSSPSSQRDSVYLLFDQIVRLSPFLTANLQEACFPYALIRSAFHHVASIAAPQQQTGQHH